MDSAGNVYIADNGNNRLRKVAPGGAINTVTAFDSSGNFYIAESTAYRLSRMTPDGITTPYASMSFNTVSAAPVPHALNEPELRCLEQIFRRSPRSGPQCRGNHLFLRPSAQRGMETARPAPALKEPSTVVLRFRRLPNCRAETETDDAPPPTASRDVILPSQYDSA